MKLAPLSIVSDRQDLEKVENRKRTNEIVGVVNGLGELVLPGMSVSEPLASDNALWLAQGQHGGYSLARARTRLVGASGAVVTAATVYAGTATVTGLDFTAAVQLASGAQVFVGCTFRQDGVNSLVQASSNAVAKFIGCTFYGSGLGQVVDNAGVIGDIVLVGCVNLTGAPVGTVTVVG